MQTEEGNAYVGYERTKGWSEETFGNIGLELEGAYEALVSRFCQNNNSILAADIGFGNGEMLSLLRRRGCNVIGIEVNEVLCQRARMSGIEAYRSMEELASALQGRKLGLVTAMHVLEHLDAAQIRSALTILRSTMTDEAVLLSAFPNGDSPFSMTAFNSDSTHRTLLTKDLCSVLGHQAGLELTTYTFFPPLSNYAQSIPRRLVSYSRHALERVLSRCLSLIYYGGTGVELAPIAVAVWRRVR